MAYSVQLFLNRALQKGADGERIDVQTLNQGIAVGGEVTNISYMEFRLGWKGGDRDHPSQSAAATLIVRRRLTGSASDFLADTLLAGPLKRGDAYVIEGRLYEFDAARPADRWSSVVNEWKFGRVVATHSSVNSVELSQIIEFSCTDLQLIQLGAGTNGPCPTNTSLSDPHFIAVE
jgi:hypothetical protein